MSTMDLIKALEFYRNGFAPDKDHSGRLIYKPTEALLDDCGNTAVQAVNSVTADLVFTCDGYDFYRDATGHWNAVHRGNPPPVHCAYYTPEPIATAKNCNLRTIEWVKPPRV